MNKNKLRKKLKNHKIDLQPKLPSIIKLIVPVKFFIQYFTEQISNTGQVLTNENKQMSIMKNLRDKLIFYLNHGKCIKLREPDISNIILSCYVFRSALLNKYDDVHSAISVSHTIAQLHSVYLYSAKNKEIARHNLRSLMNIYGK